MAFGATFGLVFLHTFGVQVYTSNPQLPFKMSQILANGDHKALLEVHWGAWVGTIQILL